MKKNEEPRVLSKAELQEVIGGALIDRRKPLVCLLEKEPEDDSGLGRRSIQ